MAKGFDCNCSVINYAGAIKAAGYDWVGRYLPHSTKADPLTRAEAVHNSKQGLWNVSIRESGMPTTIDYFTPDRGAAEAASALLACQDVGQPAGYPAFFTVDMDADPSAVLPYFRAIHISPFHDTYAVGVYGSDGVCRALYEAGLCSFFWLAWSGDPPGWTEGNSPFVPFTQWHIKQGPSATIFGIDADTDVSSGIGGAGWQVFS